MTRIEDVSGLPQDRMAEEIAGMLAYASDAADGEEMDGNDIEMLKAYYVQVMHKEIENEEA